MIKQERSKDDFQWKKNVLNKSNIYVLIKKRGDKIGNI
jgi:hypothetical protein